MAIGWSSLICNPSDESVQQLGTSWGWLIREPFVPVLFTALGDVFFQPDSGGIWWLNTGTAQVTGVAESVEQFRELLDTEIVDEWFLPELIEQLHEAGKLPEIGECYTYVTLPILEEGKYEVGNLNPVPAYEHFALTGDIHCEILSRSLEKKAEQGGEQA